MLAFGNDPNAWVKDVKPFLIKGASQFRSAGPYELKSRKYAREFEEVKSVGSATSTTRTADQTNAALYWAENPPRTWNRILNSLRLEGRLARRKRPPVRRGVPDRRRRIHRCLGREGALLVRRRSRRSARRTPTATTGRGRMNWLPLVANPPYQTIPPATSA